MATRTRPPAFTATEGEPPCRAQPRGVPHGSQFSTQSFRPQLPSPHKEEEKKKPTPIIPGKYREKRAGTRPNGPNPCSPPRANGTETGRACSTPPMPHLGHPVRTQNGTRRQWLPAKTGQKRGKNGTLLAKRDERGPKRDERAFSVPFWPSRLIKILAELN